MIQRISLNQTRLCTPGIALDAKGIALGTKGLVLLPSVDRLVMMLAAYTRERSLEDVLPTLAIHIAKSKLGMREIVVEFAAESSDHMDRIAETARLVGGFTFTGTSRHFVQYRDASAPFGYDAQDLLSTDSAIAVYHDHFTQAYDTERGIDLRSLLLRLQPRVDPSTKAEAGLRIVVAEQGLGSAAVQYFVRSNVEGEVCIAEWPPESALDDAPTRRWILRLPALPARMRGLVQSTPGLTCFVPAGQGVAVEVGYRHPLELRACPVFPAAGLALLRGRGEDPWIVERLPLMGALSTFARFEVRSGGDGAVATLALTPEVTRVPLRLVPSVSPWRRITATWVPTEQLPLLRRLAYAIPYAAIAQAKIAVTESGAVVLSKMGIEAIPLGAFFVELHPNLFLAAGHEIAPAIGPEVLARSLGAPTSLVLFIGADGRARGIDEHAFVPLEEALLEAPPWEATAAQTERALESAPIDLKTSAVGLFPTIGLPAARKAD